MVRIDPQIQSNQPLMRLLMLMLAPALMRIRILIPTIQTRRIVGIRMRMRTIMTIMVVRHDFLSILDKRTLARTNKIEDKDVSFFDRLVAGLFYLALLFFCFDAY